MNKQEKIKELEEELELAENYPFFKNRHDVAEALVERGYGNVKQAIKEFADIVVGAMENYQYDDMTEREIVQKCLEGYLSENFTK